MAARSFTIAVAKLLRDPGKPVHFECEGTLDDVFVSFSNVPPDEPIVVRGTLEAAHPGILVSATVSSVWVGECARCLEQATGAISVAVRELFEEGADEESESYGFDGEILELAKMVKDAIVLELPLVPLCSPTCRGLCSLCGANLNEGSCACDREPRDPRWAILDGMTDGRSVKSD